MAQSERVSGAARTGLSIFGRGLGALRSELGLALVVVAAMAAAAGYAERVDEIYDITLITKAAILGLAGVGLNIALGSGGLVSLGHAAFFGLGGYVCGVLAINAFNGTPVATWPFEIHGTNQFLIIWPAAMLFGGLLAAIIGALSLRSSGVYFIMITLAFAQMVYFIAISWAEYGGEDGFNFYIRNELPCLPAEEAGRPLCLDSMDPMTFCMTSLAVVTLSLLFVSTLRRSRFGLALEVSRQNAARLESVGVAAFPVRLVAFTISGMITALAGALYADLNRYTSPDMLDWHTSGDLIIFVILGGVGRLSGPLIGAALFVFLEEKLAPITDHWKALLGFLLLAIILFARGGVVRALFGEKRHG